MTNLRKDLRDLDQFKKDIKFCTQIESFLLYIWVENCQYNIISIINNGTDNSGEFQKKINSNADYRIIYTYNNILYDEKHEIKFAPTKGKMVFKVDNLKAYIKEGARILLFYNSGKISLKKPKDYDLEKHKQLIIANKEYLQWAIIECNQLTEMLKLPIETPYYMGNKPCVILKESDFSKYFKLMNLKG